MTRVQVRTANVHERGAALRLLMRHHPTAEREARVFGLLDLIRAGELNPAGLLITDDRRGAILALPVAGAGGLLWPPVCETLAQAQALVQTALTWLKSQGTRIVQAMISLPERHSVEWLEACGFQGVTELWTLSRETRSPLLPRQGGTWPTLQYQPYDPHRGQLFEATLQATYVDSLDCPEVNGLRSIAEILAGHRVQGDYDPSRWWLVSQANHPVGVVIQVDHPANDERELAYLGLIPAARGRGLASAILARVLECAAQDGRPCVVLGVDARNQPALRLYTAAGFEEVQRQRVYLWVDI
ncbi:MAG: GNAT family N-acetyltransferase [Gemmataceae bacterium]